MRFCFVLLLQTAICTALNATCDKSLLIKTFLEDHLGLQSPYVIIHQCPEATKFQDVKTVKFLQNYGFIAVNKIFENALNEKAVHIMHLECNNSKSILLQAQREKLFASPTKWLLLNWKNLNLEEIFAEIDILIESDVTIASPSCNLVKVFKRKTGQALITEPFAINQEGHLLKLQNFIQIATRRRSNFQQTVLNTCLVITHNDSINHLTDKRDKHIDTIAKVNYVFMEHLAFMYNASMNYSMESTWGYKDNASKWNGMIGRLTRKEADIGGTALFMTTDRVTIIDYIAMTTPTRSKFVFKQPKLSYITNVFTLPFHDDVWIAVVALVVLTSLGLFTVVKWEWYKRDKFADLVDVKNMDNPYSSHLQASFMDVAFVSFGAMCQQGASAVPYNIPGRIITILLFISFLFLYTSYSANIVALLQSSSTSIQTLEDLLKSRLQVGVDDTVFNHFYFPNAREPIRRALYNEKVAPAGQKPRFFPIEEGVRRMRDGLFAFHVETGAGYKVVSETFHEHEKCGLQEIAFLEVIDPYVAIQKNSSFKELLKIGLMKIHESGLQPREIGLMYTKRPICTTGGGSFIEVNLVDCYAAVLIFCIGIAASFGMFLLEFVAFWIFGNKNTYL